MILTLKAFDQLFILHKNLRDTIALQLKNMGNISLERFHKLRGHITK